MPRKVENAREPKQRGPNLGTIILRGRAALTLFLPEGATLPNPHGLLTGEAAHVRTARFASLAEIEAAAGAIAELVGAFCALHEAAAQTTRTS